MMNRVPPPRTSENDAEATAAAPHAERFVLLFGLLFPSLLTYLFFVYLADAAPIVQRSVGGGLKTVQFCLPLFWVGIVLRHRLSGIRFSTRGLLFGLVFGSLIGTCIVFFVPILLERLGELTTLTAAVQQKVNELGFVSKPQFMALSIFYTLVHSLLEEYYWRWFIFGRLRHWVRLPSAVIISSIGFTLHHIIVLAKFFGIASPATWLGTLSVGIGGAVWAILYHRTDRLFSTWCSHLLVDAAIFWLGFNLMFSK